MCNVDLGLLDVTDKESGTDLSAGQYKADEATPCIIGPTNPAILKLYKPKNWTLGFTLRSPKPV
jgi:hypothetical protein